jgi:transposase
METKIMMNQKQLKQAHVLRNYNEGRISRKEAARTLGMSERQISRKAKGMEEEGEAALVHKNTGRKPVHALSEELKEEILTLRREELYAGCNTRHFKELLSRKGVNISYNGLYRLLESAELKSPMKHKRAAKAHRRRKRKANAGELLQIDATPYE